MGLRLQSTDYKFGESVNRIIGELIAATRLYDYTVIRFNICLTPNTQHLTPNTQK